MIRWLGILLRTLGSAVRTRRELALENLALRRQLAVWRARQPRPRLTEMDRIFWGVLSRLWKNWRSSLQVVRPETVVRWHRRGFRLYWAWKSRRRWGRPAIGRDLRDLIRQMSRANRLWGAPRIHGELLKLGLTVSQATVSKYMVRPRRLPSEAWRTFLASPRRPGDLRRAAGATTRTDPARRSPPRRPRLISGRYGGTRLVNLLTDLADFLRAHRPDGRLTADATEPAWNGYLLTGVCSCGVVLSGG